MEHSYTTGDTMTWWALVESNGMIVRATCQAAYPYQAQAIMEAQYGDRLRGPVNPFYDGYAN